MLKRREMRGDTMERNLEQLRRQRSAVKKTLERMVRDGAGAAEFQKMERYLKLIDREIGRAESAD